MKKYKWPVTVWNDAQSGPCLNTNQNNGILFIWLAKPESLVISAFDKEVGDKHFKNTLEVGLWTVVTILLGH